MKDSSLTHLEWNLDELIRSDDDQFLSFGEEIEDISLELVEFRKKHSGTGAEHLIVQSSVAQLLKDAEALLRRAYSLQLAIQIVVTARDGNSDSLLLIGQHATEIYFSCLSAVEEPLSRINSAIIEAENGDLKQYKVFLDNISDIRPQDTSASTATGSSSHPGKTNFSIWCDYGRLRQSMRLTIPAVDTNPLSLTEVLLVLSRGRKEARAQTFQAYSSWMAENRGVFADLYSKLVDFARQEREKLRRQPWRSYSTRENITPTIHTDFIYNKKCVSLFHRFERLRLNLPDTGTTPIFNKFATQASLNDLFSPQDVTRLIVSAFESLSKDAGDVVKSIFKKGRVFTKPGRSSERAVNCVGVPQIGPFVSVPMPSCSAPLIARLAHEMGHAFQKTLAGSCSYFCHGIERVLSESIATFFELWTLNFMLESRSCAHFGRGDRLALLAPLFEDLYERTAYALYEQTASRIEVEELANADIVSQVWREAHEPLLTGLYTLPTEFDSWWANQYMMFRSPLTQSYYPAATVIGIALYFRAKQDPAEFMDILKDRLVLGGTVAYSSWGQPFGIDFDALSAAEIATRFLEHSMQTIEDLELAKERLR
ncbi:MAG: hypothetical protein ACO3XO_06265 [Bdellovibrionota bacterium]